MFRVVPLALAMLVGLVVVDGGFVYDDSHLLVDNPVVNGSVPIWEAFIRDFWGRPASHGFTTWRPIMPVLWAPLWAIFAGSPVAFRLLGAALHVLAVAMSLRFLRGLGWSPAESAVAGAVFAVHPLNTEAVSAIAGQADMLSFALVLGACTLALGPTSARAGLACAAAFLVASLVKESAIAFAPLAVLLFSTRDGTRTARTRAVVPVLVATLGVIALQLALPRAVGVGMVESNLAHQAHGLMRLLLGLHNVGQGLVMTVWPQPLVPNHGYAAVELHATALGPWATIGAVLLVVGVVGGLWAVRERNLAWIATLSVLYAPVLLQTHWLIRLVTDLAERLLYPSVLGISMAFTIVLFHAGSLSKARAALATALAIGCFGASLPVRRAWTDDDALWLYAVVEEPRSTLHRHNVSNVYFRQSDVADGAYHRLVYWYLLDVYPEPVPWDRLERLDASPAETRVAALPAELQPNDPCPLVARLTHEAERYPPLRDYLARVWTPYSRCGPRVFQ